MYLSPARTPPRRGQRRRLTDYLAAFAILCLATLVRAALDPFVHNQAIYVIYTGSLVVIAMKCGWNAALLAAVAAAFTANYLFVPPRYEFIPHGEDWVSMGVFGVVAAGVIALVARWKRAEETVRERAEELQAILQTAPAAVFVTRDPGAHWIDGNSMAYQIFGVRPGSNLSLTAPEGAPPTAFRSMKDGRELSGEELPMQMAMAGKGPVIDCDLDLVQPDGTSRTLFGNAAPLFDKNGNVRGAVGTFLDITERKHAEEALRDANRVKDEFLATLSHELRTPLNAISGWADMLRTGKLDRDEAQRAVESIYRNAKAQNTLIDDVLDVSRIVRGTVHLEKQPVNLGTLLEAAVESVRPTAEAKDVSLVTELETVPFPVAGDPGRLRQVFWNLLVNAVKFTPAGGHVRVSLTSGPQGAAVTVADSGVGISQELLPHVFDRFRQGDSSITRRHSGLGLGLAIVRHMVELHGGAVTAESPGDGQGATFTVTLPGVPWERRQGGPAMPRAVPAVEPSRDEPPGLCGVEVLVVDDEQEAREVAAAVLRHHGATVSVAADADEAVRQYETGAPNVLLLDIAMPGGDGYELLQRLRARDGDGREAVPAIALTALARQEDRRRAYASGFQLHLAKPIDSLALVRAISALCRGQSV